MCEYCGNTGLCYSFFAMAIVWIYRKGRLLIRRLRCGKSASQKAIT